MKQIQLSAPATIDDLRIRHNKVLSDEKFKTENFDIKLACEFVAGITGVDLPTIYTIDTADVIKVFHHCLNLFNGYKKGEPAKTIEIEGTIYFMVDPHKVAAGWHIDLSALPEDPPPTLLMALLYIPAGVYGQKDENDNIKFPLAEREKLFKEHFKLTDFLNVIGFFLKKSKQSTNAFTELAKK